MAYAREGVAAASEDETAAMRTSLLAAVEVLPLLLSLLLSLSLSLLLSLPLSLSLSLLLTRSSLLAAMDAPQWLHSTALPTGAYCYLLLLLSTIHEYEAFIAEHTLVHYPPLLSTIHQNCQAFSLSAPYCTTYYYYSPPTIARPFSPSIRCLTKRAASLALSGCT